MISYKITDELTKKLKHISELAVGKKAFVESLDASCREAIHRYAKISSIGASTRIENAVLTDTEIAWVDETLKRDSRPSAFSKEQQYIVNKLSKEKERSIEEVVGYRDLLLIVYDQAQELFPLTGTAVRGFHKELLQYYPKAKHYLGNYKKVPNSVVERILETGKTREVLRTAEPGPITDAAMSDLLEWYNETVAVYPWCVAVAVEFVFRFLAIHPFQDGNGRLGRALFYLVLLQSNDEGLKATVPYISIDRQIEKHKEEYYMVLRKCSGGKFLNDPRKYKYEYFLNFMIKILKASLGNDIDYYVSRYNSYVALSDTAQKVLKCFKEHPEQRLQTKDIMKLTGIPRRSVIHSINVLSKASFLQKKGSGPTIKYQLTF
ncbi:MAG: Fic family protein [Proteobacteria bacterium]|nr:Fic family protein [Pseudomonadota bacterium]